MYEFTITDLVSLSLYGKMEFTPENGYSLYSVLENRTTQFDSYCIYCKKDSTFRNNINPSPAMINGTIYYDRLKNKEKFHKLTFKCQRNAEHNYLFFFRTFNGVVEKVGQSPSPASIENDSIKKYRKLLNDDFKDFSKAIGLYSHGVGVGSFVYLRRIFENLIHEKIKLGLSSGDFVESDFSNLRMSEKIEKLSKFLPDILVENKRIYGIISKGIHELTEEECLKLFPHIQNGIELILDEKLHDQEKLKKAQSLRKFVSSSSI